MPQVTGPPESFVFPMVVARVHRELEQALRSRVDRWRYVLCMVAFSAAIGIAFRTYFGFVFFTLGLGGKLALDRVCTMKLQRATYEVALLGNLDSLVLLLQAC